MLLAATNAENANWRELHAEVIAKEVKIKSRRKRKLPRTFHS